MENKLCFYIALVYSVSVVTSVSIENKSLSDKNESANNLDQLKDQDSVRVKRSMIGGVPCSAGRIRFKGKCVSFKKYKQLKEDSAADDIVSATVAVIKNTTPSYDFLAVISLFLERNHSQTTENINGVKSNESMSTKKAFVTKQNQTVNETKSTIKEVVTTTPRTKNSTQMLNTEKEINSTEQGLAVTESDIDMKTEITKTVDLTTSIKTAKTDIIDKDQTFITTTIKSDVKSTMHSTSATESINMKDESLPDKAFEDTTTNTYSSPETEMNFNQDTTRVEIMNEFNPTTQMPILVESNAKCTNIFERALCWLISVFTFEKLNSTDVKERDTMYSHSLFFGFCLLVFPYIFFQWCYPWFKKNVDTRNSMEMDPLNREDN